MSKEEAATILRNTAWLGSNAEREKVEEAIEVLASAQPEPTTEIQEILEYLDTTLHPIVSPDNWNVYSELHDMVSKLPTAQPEIIYCRECKHFDSESSGLDDAWCHVWGGTTFGDQFCSYGEKEAKDDQRRGY